MRRANEADNVQHGQIACLTCETSEARSYSVRLLMPTDQTRKESWRLVCESRDMSNGGKHWQRSIGAGYAQHLLHQLDEARIPAIPPFMSGCDGATYELSFTQGLNAVTYRWWPDAPKSYEPLVRFGNELLQLGRFQERLTVMEEIQQT